MSNNFGDGTSWSSEKGNQSPRPEGNSGNNDKNNSPSTPQAKQVSAVQSDPVVREKLANLLIATRALDPSAKVHLIDLSASGTITISIDNLDVEQASTLQLSGMLLGFKYSEGKLVIGQIETGHKLTEPGSSNNSGASGGIDGIISNAESSTKPQAQPTVEERAAKLYGSDKVSRKALINMYKESRAKGVIPSKVKGDLRKKVQMMLDEDKKRAAAEAVKKQDEKDALLKTSEIIADVGEKLNKQLGAKYKTLANEIAGNIRNFQGKNIRSFSDAMKSMNKVTSNPSMKINKADKDAIVNAWKHVNAQDMANKLGNLSRAFKAVDTVMKVEKVREKSIIGYETGNWGPLVLEIESWVVGGIAAGVALGLLGSIVSTFLIAGSFPATAAMIIGILVISLLASLIDDKVVDKINNEIIRPAH